MQTASPPAAATRVLLTLLMTVAAAGRAHPSADAKHRLGPVERLLPFHPTGHCRPIPARQASPKLSDAQRWLLKFRFREAAVRDLTHPARSRQWPPAACRRPGEETDGIQGKTDHQDCGQPELEGLLADPFGTDETGEGSLESRLLN